jgi:hypothetical protein
MKYKINQSVVIKKCKLIKQISDAEIICGKIIYYMSDHTSYCESQIFTTEKGVKRMETLTLSPNIDNFINFIDNGRMVKGYEKLFNITHNLEEESIKPINKWKKWFMF